MKRLLFLMLGWLAVAAGAGADPLGQSAQPSALAPQRLLTAISRITDNTWIAVGQRGHILLSQDRGTHWRQSPVPVRVDLTNVQAVTPRRLFAVGHGGTVLGSVDGGAHWTALLDGNFANHLAARQFGAGDGSATAQAITADLARNVAAGADKPLFDLHFTDDGHGFVVGAYNLLFETNDGGKTWHSWFADNDNSRDQLHLYAVRSHQGKLFVAGESGLLMVLDTKRRRFVRIDTGYRGSFFGLLSTPDYLLAYGMRGTAMLSRDGGQHWTRLDTGLGANIVGAVTTPDGSVWLAEQTGRLSVSHDGGQHFRTLPSHSKMPVTGLLIDGGQLTLIGLQGLRQLALPKD